MVTEVSWLISARNFAFVPFATYRDADELVRYSAKYPLLMKELAETPVVTNKKRLCKSVADE